jgi:hypothetical protein
MALHQRWIIGNVGTRRVFFCLAFVKNGQYEIPDLLNYRGFVMTRIRGLVTNNQRYRNEFYRMMVTGGLICTILEHHVFNYRYFVMNFTGLSYYTVLKKYE